jgi:alpha-N-arabinofuranosidase
MDGEDFRVYYGQEEEKLTELCRLDGRVLNPQKVGCMTGTMIGMYASGNGKNSENKALFSFFELVQ